MLGIVHVRVVEILGIFLCNSVLSAQRLVPSGIKLPEVVSEMCGAWRPDSRRRSGG